MNPIKQNEQKRIKLTNVSKYSWQQVKTIQPRTLRDALHTLEHKKARAPYAPHAPLYLTCPTWLVSLRSVVHTEQGHRVSLEFLFRWMFLNFVFVDDKTMSGFWKWKSVWTVRVINEFFLKMIYKLMGIWN